MYNVGACINKSRVQNVCSHKTSNLHREVNDTGKMNSMQKLSASR